MKHLGTIFRFILVYGCLWLASCSAVLPQYIVQFVAGDGATIVSAQIVSAGSKINEPENPVKDGYVFGGWFKDAETSTPFSFDSDTVTSSIILYAKWTLGTGNDDFGISVEIAGETLTEAANVFAKEITILTQHQSAPNDYLDTLTVTINKADGVSIQPDPTSYSTSDYATSEGITFTFTKNGQSVTKTIKITTVDETEEEQLIRDTSTQTEYASEAEGAPARPTWVDAFRHYQELEFFKKGRYVLVWRKDPGDQAQNTADRWELHQISFKDPTAMSQADKWGAAIDPDDVEEVSVIFEDNDLTQETHSTAGDVTLPTDLLPPTTFSTVASDSTTPITVNVAADTQVGYHPITNGRQLVVAYKVRLYRTINDTDDKGNLITRELYNDSTIIMVNYKAGLFVQITGTSGGSGGSGGTGGSSSLVPDTITTFAQVRTELGFTANQNFITDYENRKVTGTAPIENLMTKDDFDALFPPSIRETFHDPDLDYYTWDNLVEASRYFPLFLGEGTNEDKYRELAAFFGNKSHETGDGWAALGTARWTYGLVWIVELAALSSAGIATRPSDKEDLYKPYLDTYTLAGHADYPPVAGKSYHGRGPVQLSWNYNYGMMSEVLFGNKDILLENPNLIARNGFLGWASALWFWMEPQGNKPSAHDVMVGNVDLSEPYTAPTDKTNRSARTHTDNSKGHDAKGTEVSYKSKAVPAGAEVGFGMTINIINGGLEANTGSIDNRHARRIAFYARYLDYFGKKLNGAMADPISPQVGGTGGDPVPAATVTLLKSWANWHYLPADYPTGDQLNFAFPTNDIPSILASHFQASFW
ncbi:MAG: hypothetical protein B0D92_01775 [Spirochaeta sp. LUC14_002_19_P3]|nr:MAG: hypothetical protein B0D92_01775 [Spirochaeta sp. LUC14_002_19_P3]